MPDVFVNKRIEKTVEILCQRGCGHVRQVIRDIETGNADRVSEIREPADSDRILAELKEIMSVYDDSGGSCCPVPDKGHPVPITIKKASRQS